MNDFEIKEKEELFDKIADLYYNKNFGRTSKSEFELILFDAYMKHKNDRDKKESDDYNVSKELGITQSRVRSLKERRQLVYPDDKLDWRMEFADCVQYAKCDLDNFRIKMTLPDVNVLREFQYFVENNGWYFETQLNSKLVQLPYDCFVDICFKINESGKEFNDNAKNTISKLKYEAGVGNFLDNFTKDGLKDFLKSASVNVIEEVLTCIPFGDFAIKAFSGLIKSMKNSTKARAS